jgi:exopolyphosphatase/guanosine-5'-triphosphate,3'-diphosphate pyrophosphatase
VSSERVAAIDIGTVTTRLLVADVDDGVVTEVGRRSIITQLGEGWTGTGVLSDEAMSRVTWAVAGFMAEARVLGATRHVAVATSASRDAANASELLERLATAGLRPEIITGEREAYLTFSGATYAHPGADMLVVDVGGGSTELVVGSATAGGETGRTVSVEAARSVDVGSRRLTERFLVSDPPSAHEIDDAAGRVAAELSPFFSGLGSRPREMIATSGVATSLAAIEQALDPYDPARVHGFRLTGAALVGTMHHLASLKLEARRTVVGLEPDRASVIVGGVLVLQTALALSGLTSTLVSEHDILYGMVLDSGAPEASTS